MGFRVVIVGGSISGLTLANVLEKFDINYVLLEGHNQIAPQLGASIGLLPSGLRTLDQIGCYDRIHAEAGNTYYRARMRLYNGTTWYDKGPISFSERLEKRIGYPQIFIDRQRLVQILYDNLKCKDCVLTSRRVSHVEMDTYKAVAYTTDGSSYAGDIIVGADGVHSAIRREMWRNAAEAGSKLFKKNEELGLRADSKCIFGISKRPPTMPAPPFQINAFFKDCGYMILSAPQDRLYWFLFTEMDKTTGKMIPKFTKEDERRLAEDHFGNYVTESATFQDIYEHRQQAALVALEENVFSRWHYKRIVIIGDAAHKVHPISAQGGNSAIETAVVLANHLKNRIGRLSREETLSEDALEKLFAHFQEQRFCRVVAAMEQGRRTTSVSIKDTLVSRLFVDHFFARFGQGLIYRLIIKNTDTAPLIEGIPTPKRHLDANLAHLASSSRNISWRTRVVGSLSAGLFAIYVYFYLRQMKSGYQLPTISLVRLDS